MRERWRRWLFAAGLMVGCAGLVLLVFGTWLVDGCLLLAGSAAFVAAPVIAFLSFQGVK